MQGLNDGSKKMRGSVGRVWMPRCKVAEALGAFGCQDARSRKRWAHGNATGQAECDSVGRMATPQGRQSATALGALGSREAANAHARPNGVGSVGGVGVKQGARQRHRAANESRCKRLRWVVGNRADAVVQRALRGCKGAFGGRCAALGSEPFFRRQDSLLRSDAPYEKALKSCYCGRSGGAYLGIYFF